MPFFCSFCLEATTRFVFMIAIKTQCLEACYRENNSLMTSASASVDPTLFVWTHALQGLLPGND